MPQIAIKFCENSQVKLPGCRSCCETIENSLTGIWLRLRGNLQLARSCLQSWWLGLLYVFIVFTALLVQCVFSHSRSFVLCHFQLHPNCLPMRTFHEWRFASKHSHTRRCKCRISHFCLECPASCTKPEWLGQKSNGIMILEYPRYLRYKFVKETNLQRSCKASVPILKETSPA